MFYFIDAIGAIFMSLLRFVFNLAFKIIAILVPVLWKLFRFVLKFLWLGIYYILRQLWRGVKFISPVIWGKLSILAKRLWSIIDKKSYNFLSYFRSTPKVLYTVEYDEHGKPVSHP